MKKSWLLISILFLLTFSAGGTLAYIAVVSDRVTNQFEPAEVECRVNAGNTIDVTNVGDVDAFIRAAIVVNWMDSSGNVYGTAPKSGDYAIEINEDDWIFHDGFYYYKHRVTPEPDNVTPDEDTTADLVEAISIQGVAPNGYKLSVEVVAEAIQADGVTAETTKAYADAWGISISLGN